MKRWHCTSWWCLFKTNDVMDAYRHEWRTGHRTEHKH